MILFWFLVSMASRLNVSPIIGAYGWCNCPCIILTAICIDRYCFCVDIMNACLCTYMRVYLYICIIKHGIVHFSQFKIVKSDEFYIYNILSLHMRINQKCSKSSNSFEKIAILICLLN
jgi:hypothetical protein